MLRIDKVTKEFPQSSGGRKRVLEDISLKIEDNEFVCILGKSGCGKSTLLNLLAGYTVPDYGALYLDRNMIHGQGDCISGIRVISVVHSIAECSIWSIGQKRSECRRNCNEVYQNDRT